MTGDERMNRLVRSWLRDTTSSPHTASGTVAEVLSHLPHTRQRGRWWPLPTFRRRSGEARAHRDLEPATLERSLQPIPIARGRTLTMLSPAKAIIAGALVALGGLLMVAQPLSPPAAVVPGAEMTELSGVPVNVTQECVGHDPCIWTASDPRLTGTLDHEWLGGVGVDGTEEDFANGFDYAEVTFEGPEGDWTGHMYALWGEPSQHFLVLSGKGANEGWQLVASNIDPEPDGDFEWRGTLYQGELPPFGASSDTTGD